MQEAIDHWIANAMELQCGLGDRVGDGLLMRASCQSVCRRAGALGAYPHRQQRKLASSSASLWRLVSLQVSPREFIG